MEDHRNEPAPESAPSQDELRDLEPRPVADQADGADADVKGGRKAGGEQQEYLKVTMSDVMVSS